MHLTTDGGAARQGSAGGRPGATDQPRRLSVCYVVPGSDLDVTAGPSRNAIELARALSRWADVTLAFRRVPTDLVLDGVQLTDIDPDAKPSTRAGDDSAIRGMTYGEFARYMLALRRFVLRQLPRHDAILEKTWLLSGYASALARRRGVPAIPVENFLPIPGKGSKRGLPAYVRHAVGRFLSGHFLRGAPLIIAETEHLRHAMESAWHVPPERFRVVGVGIDKDRFRPLDQGDARRMLGIEPDRVVLVYVGILNTAHDLRPVIDAFGEVRPEAAELHVVGDGPARTECERQALRQTGPRRVRFHGAVPHERVPVYIAAADLCLAPYDPAAFPGGEVGYSILKIREYLSSGRSVASIPSGAIPELVLNGETGFLFDNDAASWRAFLASPPSRDRLREMGEAAARTELPTWDQVGHTIYRAIEEVTGRQRSASQ